MGHLSYPTLTDSLPSFLYFILGQPEIYLSLFTGNASAGGIDDDDDDVPMLVEDFEAASKTDTGEY